MHDPGFDPQYQIKSGMVGHTCNSSTLEVGAEGPAVQGHPWLHSQFKDSLEYMRPCLKKQNETTHFSFKFGFLLFIYFLGMKGGFITHAIVLWRTEDNFQELALMFHHGSRDQT